MKTYLSDSNSEIPDTDGVDTSYTIFKGVDAALVVVSDQAPCKADGPGCGSGAIPSLRLKLNHKVIVVF